MQKDKLIESLNAAIAALGEKAGPVQWSVEDDGAHIKVLARYKSSVTLDWRLGEEAWGDYGGDALLDILLWPGDGHHPDYSFGIFREHGFQGVERQVLYQR